MLALIMSAPLFKKIVQSIIFKKGYSYQIYTILSFLLRIIYYLGCYHLDTMQLMKQKLIKSNKNFLF